jgi:hypothetical protein
LRINPWPLNMARRQGLMANKKATKAVAKKAAGRKSVPYDLIAKMAQEGADALTIAKKINRVNSGGDPTHTVRALISGMRTKGWKNASGKLQKLKVERVGHTKKMAPKKGKKTAAKPASKPPVKASTQTDGKSLAAGDGKKE